MIQLSSKDYFALKNEVEKGEAFFEVVRDGDSVYLNSLPSETMFTAPYGYYQILSDNMSSVIPFKPDQILHLVKSGTTPRPSRFLKSISE